jgi:hypothetical protein
MSTPTKGKNKSPKSKEKTTPTKTGGKSIPTKSRGNQKNLKTFNSEREVGEPGLLRSLFRGEPVFDKVPNANNLDSEVAEAVIVDPEEKFEQPENSSFDQRELVNGVPQAKGHNLKAKPINGPSNPPLVDSSSSDTAPSNKPPTITTPDTTTPKTSVSNVKEQGQPGGKPPGQKFKTLTNIPQGNLKIVGSKTKVDNTVSSGPPGDR